MKWTKSESKFFMLSLKDMAIGFNSHLKLNLLFFTLFRHAGTEILQYLVKESEFKALKVHSTPTKFENAALVLLLVRSLFSAKAVAN